MTTRRTKIQLAIFVIITLVGVSFVGARYARLDRVFVHTQYQVVAHFNDSGGIFAGGEVTYRGVGIGQVKRLTLTNQGVDVVMDIDNKWDKIPANTLAVVGNRSAVGEQYVELQPQTDSGPYLHGGSTIQQRDTQTPIATDTLLTHLAELVDSVHLDSLRTTVTELGKAFGGTGEDLQRIIDTSNSFIQAANDNFDTTTALIHDGNTVLQGQIDSTDAIKNFAGQLSKFSEVLAGANPDVIRLIDTGADASNQLRTFLLQYGVNLGDLINNLVTTGDIIVKHLDGIKQILVVYPYVVEGGFTVVSKSPDTGLYDAHFGLILTSTPVCHAGYGGTDTHPPQDGSSHPLNVDARCTEPASQSNARGSQHAPLNRVGPTYDATNGSPVIASYDPTTHKLSWGDPSTTVDPTLQSTGTVAPPTLGEESWKWLFLQPLATSQE